MFETVKCPFLQKKKKEKQMEAPFIHFLFSKPHIVVPLIWYDDYEAVFIGKLKE